MKFCIVTGGRDYGYPRKVWDALDKVLPDVVIHGDSGSTDKAAKSWGKRYAIEHSYPAEWKLLGRRGGPRRNRTMAVVAQALLGDNHEIVCLAFPGGDGTANCKEALRLRGFTVLDGEAVAERGVPA